MCAYLLKAKSYAVHDVILMAKGDSFKQHQHVALHLRFSQWLLSFSNHFRQVGQHVLEDEHETRAVWEDISQTHNLARNIFNSIK